MSYTSSTLNELECTYCSAKYSTETLHTTCKECGKVLFAKYDLEKAKETLNKDSMKHLSRPYNIWRMNEIMPVKNKKYQLTLGEGWTPLLHLPHIGDTYDLPHLFIKDEGLNPTLTFKSRGLVTAVSKAMELGVEEFVIPTAGNAGCALAAYVARAGKKAHVFMPVDAPELMKKEVNMFGADLHLVDGLITDAGKIAKDQAQKNNWFDVSTLKEPYRAEGKKTMGLELAEQLHWNLPDVIIYPTGGGTGIIGMWKAFNELETLGFIGSSRPRMISVQSSGCCPIVRAFKEKTKHAEFFENANTIAAGLRVPAAIGDYLILDILKESQGTALSVDDKEIIVSMKEMATKEGILLAPEAAATVSTLKILKEKGEIDKDEQIVLFGTGSGFTTTELWK